LHGLILGEPLKLHRRTRRRLKIVAASVGGAVAAALALTVVLTSVSHPAPPPVSDKVQAAYDAGKTLAPTVRRVPDKLADVLPKLHTTKDEFVLTVLGDSTGVGPQAWVRQTVERVAEASGRYTAIHEWSPDTGAYAPPVYVGPEGPVTLIVYNGSASGKNASYAAENLPALLPNKSDLIIINHGHNSPALLNAMEHIKRLINMIGGTANEYSAIVVTAQNPRLDAGAAVDAEVVAATRELPVTYPSISVLDAYAAFEAAGDLEPMLAGDGLHPAAPGHKVWADAAVKLLGF
jgi:lysophospholipase L1-like esterase